MKKIAVLGSTGSIGTSTLKVARHNKDRIKISALFANSNIDLLSDQVIEFGVKNVGVFNENKIEDFKILFKEKGGDINSIKIYSGKSGLIDIIEGSDSDMLLMSIVGIEGLQPCIKALDKGTDIALASKEIMVMAGRLVMEKARANKCNIIPVDSEHNAIFQCLQGNDKKENLSRIILTASGGPFRNLDSSEFSKITPKQALAHPTWDMGKKISVDSATLANKGLEMIEAKFLFDIEMNMIDVIVHPQSIIHSMVEFVDGSCLAQLSSTDMCFPIQYAITYPKRLKSSLKSLDFSKLAKLEFIPPREDDFPALNLARIAGEKEGTMPVVFNSSNEIAVDSFLKEKILFPDIWKCIESVMNNNKSIKNPSLEDLINADLESRIKAKEFISKIQ